MKKIVVFKIILAIISAGLINAQRSTGNFTDRQVSQQARIGQGIKSKELTRREVCRLEREQRRIQIEKRVAKADGTISPQEKRFVKREHNRVSRHINRQKNDAQEIGSTVMKLPVGQL